MAILPRALTSGNIAFFSVFLILILLLTPISSSASFTIEDEKKIGAEFHERLLRSDLIIQNERLNDYIDRIGRRLLSSGQKAPFDFRFFIVRSQAINAFATPGGYVYVNLGLVNLAENEGQLASVLAHEIAHVNNRHIAAMIEKSQKVNAATMAAIIAGALLGGGGELTAAVTGFSLATASMAQLKYSREHEEESDRLGIGMLVAAGYSSQGALDFLKNMRRHEYFSSNTPSYFLTHPGIEDRIRYTDSLLQTIYPPSGREEITGNFRRFKTIITLESADKPGIQRYFTANLQIDPRSVDDLYGLAVVQEMNGLLAQSLANFQQALALAPDDPDVTRDMGISMFRTGKYRDSIQLLNRSLRIDSKDPRAISFLGRAYLSAGEFEKSLETLLKGQDLAYDKDDVFYFTLASAYGQLKRPGESHYYFGISFRMRNNIRTSLHHFREAIKHLPKNSDLFLKAQKEIDAPKELDRTKRGEPAKRK